jgi:hypothetical protein
MAASRNACGDFFEEATAQLLRGARMATDCRCEVCPDVSYCAGYAESKSVGLNGAVIIYTHRREKDLQFMRENKCSLLYAIWHHSFPVKDAHFEEELRDGLARTMESVILLPAQVLHALLLPLPTRVLNTRPTSGGGNRLGYGTNGYGTGWSVKLATLARLAKRAAVLPPGSLAPHGRPNARPVHLFAACTPFPFFFDSIAEAHP